MTKMKKFGSIDLLTAIWKEFMTIDQKVKVYSEVTVTFFITLYGDLCDQICDQSNVKMIPQKAQWVM